MESTFTIHWPPLLQLAFLILLIIYVTYTVILYYHWQSYGTDQKISGITYLAYFSITLPLLAVMGGALFIISS